MAETSTPSKDMISDLLGMDDAALGVKLGFADKVKDFKADLARASKLDEKGKAKVNSHLNKIFTPDTYRVDDLKWQIDSAEKRAKTGCCPGDMLAHECGEC